VTPRSQTPRPDWSEAALDGATSALFAGFVGLLFLGYLYSNFPYEGVSVAPLVLALAVLFWGNLRSERRERAVASAASP